MDIDRREVFLYYLSHLGKMKQVIRCDWKYTATYFRWTIKWLVNRTISHSGQALILRQHINLLSEKRNQWRHQSSYYWLHITLGYLIIVYNHYHFAVYLNTTFCFIILLSSAYYYILMYLNFNLTRTGTGTVFDSVSNIALSLLTFPTIFLKS